MFNSTSTICRGNFSCRCLRNFLFFINSLKNTFRCRNRLLNNISNIGNLGNRLIELSSIRNKCLNITNRNDSLNDKKPSDNADSYICQISNKHHDWHINPRYELSTTADIIQLFVNIGELLKCRSCLAVSLHSLMPFIPFFHTTIQITECGLLTKKILLRTFQKWSDNK